MARREAVILDVDGTLVDSNYEHVRAWYRAFRGENLTVPQASIHRLIGMGGDNLVPKLLECPPDDPRVQRIQDAHGEIYRGEYLPRVVPLPGVPELMRRVKGDGCRICLATSAHRDELEHYVRLLGIGDDLDETVDQDDVRTSKPAADIFNAALRKLAVEAEAALLVGDSVWDGEAAGRVGLPWIGVLTGGFCETELKRAGALAVYRDLPQLLENWGRP